MRVLVSCPVLSCPVLERVTLNDQQVLVPTSNTLQVEGGGLPYLSSTDQILGSGAKKTNNGAPDWKAVAQHQPKIRKAREKAREKAGEGTEPGGQGSTPQQEPFLLLLVATGILF